MANLKISNMSEVGSSAGELLNSYLELSMPFPGGFETKRVSVKNLVLGGLNTQYEAKALTEYIADYGSRISTLEAAGGTTPKNLKGTGTFSINRADGSTEGTNSATLGTHCTATEKDSFACGTETKANGESSFAGGNDTQTEGANSFAFGKKASAAKEGSVAIGSSVKSNGTYAFAFGYSTTASGAYSYAEGNNTTASEENAHAEGKDSTASGQNSHAEGNNSNATKENAHAEGANTKATGVNSHAEGSNTTASGIAAHAEGSDTSATSSYSHAEGLGTSTDREAQSVRGKYNASTPSGLDYLDIVGNGTPANRANAYALDTDGNGYFAGDVFVDSDQISVKGLNESITEIEGHLDEVDNTLSEHSDRMDTIEENIPKIVVLTLEEYQALGPELDLSTLYLIKKGV